MNQRLLPLQWLIITCISLFLFPTLHGTYLRNGDTQIWAGTTIWGSLTRKIDLQLETQWRFGDNVDELYLQYTQLGMRFHFNDYVSLMPGYRQLYLRELNRNTFFTIYAPLFDLYIQSKNLRWKIFNRTRDQYDMARSQFRKDINLFRNLTQITTDWYFFSKQILFYFADEWFISSNRGFSQNRFSLGFTANLPPLNNGNLYFMLRSLKLSGGHWITQNVFGTQLIFNF